MLMLNFKILILPSDFLVNMIILIRYFLFFFKYYFNFFIQVILCLIDLGNPIHIHFLLLSFIAFCFLFHHHCMFIIFIFYLNLFGLTINLHYICIQYILHLINYLILVIRIIFANLNILCFITIIIFLIIFIINLYYYDYYFKFVIIMYFPYFIRFIN